MPQYDIAIVGGGLVGASLAVALRNARLRVVMIEAVAPPESAPSWDERCIALNDASRRIFEAMEVWPSMLPEAAPILATHISEKGRFGVARFAAADAGLDALGYNLPLRVIGGSLWQRLSEQGVELRLPVRVDAVSTTADAVELRLVAAADDAPAETLSARLVVAADGARSTIRELLRIGAETDDYHQHAIVSAVRLARAHGGVAYERFTPDGPLALIPKPGRACSLVWTQPSEQSAAMMALDDAQYLAAAQQAFGERLGPFVELGRRHAWPLARVVARQTVAPRVVFIGNAAQSLHPVAAQGFNLGLRDVATLARTLEGSRDPGDAAGLASFEQARARDRRHASELTNLMVRTFSNRIPGLAQTRHLGLAAIDLLPGLREQVLRQHLGHYGLPRAS